TTRPLRGCSPTGGAGAPVANSTRTVRPASTRRRRQTKCCRPYLSGLGCHRRFQDPCHRMRCEIQARRLHISRSRCAQRRRKAETFTVDETSFPNAKSRDPRLIAFKAFADLAGKGSLFVITIAAARRLSPESFGIFALGSTLGWM